MKKWNLQMKISLEEKDYIQVMIAGAQEVQKVVKNRKMNKWTIKNQTKIKLR